MMRIQPNPLLTIKVKIMMKLLTVKTSLLTISLVLALIACTPTLKVRMPIHITDSGKVLFSNIITNKVASGTRVSGNVRKRFQAGKHISIPGHIHIVHKDNNGKELETITARTHRKYGNSEVWHFDGVLDTKEALPIGSTIVVKYHNHH